MMAATLKERPRKQCRGESISSPPASRLSAHRLADLHGRFSNRQVKYILHVLTPGELSVVADPADTLIIARIKRMPDDRLAKFDRLVPTTEASRKQYHRLQLQWLRDEEYLLGTRLGRKPTSRELFVDFMNNHNGLRFRAYFALKFPQKMARLACALAE